MSLAKDIMTSNPVTVSPETSIKDAAELLITKRFNGLPVVDDKGSLVGVLCQSDLISQQKKIEIPSLFSFLGGYLEFGKRETEAGIKKMTALVVRDAMTPHPQTVTSDTPVEDIASYMVDSKNYTIPVVDAGKLVGVIGKEDILGTLLNK